MTRTLRLKYALMVNAYLHEFIAFELIKEYITVKMIKDDQSFHKRQIFIKMEKPLLILLKMDDSKQTHMENLLFMVLMVDDCISMSMPELNDGDYLPPVTEL